MGESDSSGLKGEANLATGTSDVELSTLAVVASGLALLSLVLLPGYLSTFRRGGPLPLVTRQAYSCFLSSVSLLATILGLISVARIATSGGKLSGRAFAWVGVSAPVAQLLLFLLVMLTARTGSIAFRMTCGTNLSGIGKAMRIYANDYEDEFPRAGGPQSPWAARIPDWKAGDRYTAYGINPISRTRGQVSISASLFLLVKYSEVPPERFVCRGEDKVKPFDLANLRGLPRDFELIDAWDFGPEPPKYVSYAYHMIYGPEKLSDRSDPGMAILSERNPWIASPFAKARDFSQFAPDVAPFGGTVQTALQGNTLAHQGDGQNVLFLDTHVEFAKRSFCGVDDDNIYTSWDGTDKVRGKPAAFGDVPADLYDSLLVNDPAIVSR